MGELQNPVVRRERRDPGRIVFGVLRSLLQGGMIRKNETVFEIRAYRMLHDALPVHGAQFTLQILGRVLVLDAGCYVENATDADQYATRAVVLNKGHFLRIEETQRVFRAEVTGKTIEQGALILVILNLAILET